MAIQNLWNFLARRSSRIRSVEGRYTGTWDSGALYKYLGVRGQGAVCLSACHLLGRGDWLSGVCGVRGLCKGQIIVVRFPPIFLTRPGRFRVSRKVGARLLSRGVRPCLWRGETSQCAATTPCLWLGERERAHTVFVLVLPHPLLDS